MMELVQILKNVDLFQGLTADEVEKVSQICAERRFSKGQWIAHEGESGSELFIITEGLVDVLLGAKNDPSARVVVSLGGGQVIGEMALLDQGPRSASLRAANEPTILQVIQRDDFEKLCQQDTHIGYVVMRNLAADLSFKLRHQNLELR